MTFIKMMTAALVAASFASYAQAQDSGNQDSGAYGGISASAYVTNPTNALLGPELFTLDAKLGYNFNTYFGVETQGSVGLNTDTENISFFAEPASLSSKVDYSVAAFGVARLPITEKFGLFARAGIHNTQVTSVLDDNGAIDSFTLTETGAAFGAGGQFNFDKKNAIRADYTYFDDTNAETLSLGYVRKF